MLITVPPGVESGQVIQISAPAPMVTERTVLSDASSATVGTWSTPPYSCCYGCCGGCYGCCGGPTEMVITESHQVQAIHYEQHHILCCCEVGHAVGSGSREVNDISMTIVQTMNPGVGSYKIINTYTITEDTRGQKPTLVRHHELGLAAKTAKKSVANHPCMCVETFTKTA